MRRRYIVGVDEVGRGPLAGPVVVGAVLVPFGLKIIRKGLRDSKKLSASAREDWAGYVKSHPKISHALAAVSPRVIDRMNISRAANLAALRATTRLVASAGIKMEHCKVYLDGGLYLGNGRARLAGKTVIKGDEKIAAISLASIVAKVHRDAIMARLGKKHPGYGFAEHKGYGTRGHLKAIRSRGLSPAHRRSFAPVN